LKQYRDAMARLIASHGGRVVNTWGDGLLAEFPSVVEAVRAAVDTQNELAEHNAGKATATRMLFRIGINLGDVIVEGDDLYGDGVNIAARLQTQAAAGGIVISNTVYDQVRNKVPVGFDFLGNLSVKNIHEGVPSYAVRIGESAAKAAPQREQPFGRDSSPAAVPPLATSAPLVELRRDDGGLFALGSARIGRKAGVMGVIGLAIVAFNLLSWSGTFWAAWPLLAFAVAIGLMWAKSTPSIDTSVASLGVIAAGIVGINLLSWSGTFWAKWPLLGLAIAAGVRYAASRGPRRDAAE
jgi:hypothetical protein